MSTFPVIEIDDRSGFCHGVVAAINKAEDELNTGKEPLYCIGDIVHNSDEVERLQNRGLITIGHSDLDKLHNAKVLFRAHGEPPSTYQTAQRNGIRVVDATCPVVLKLQQRIKLAYNSSRPRPQIVIYGKKGHAEVNGLVGQTQGNAIVIESPEMLDQLDFSRDIALYSQTTMPLEGFNSIIENIKRRIHDGVKFEYFDTICRQVANRVEHLIEFAKLHDVVLFVAGAKSSNGKVLLGHCKRANPNTHLISHRNDFDSSWINGATSIGICGATSTPRWLMEEVRSDVINSLESNG